jgi:S-adenosylmethionine hydrolase
MRPRTARPIVTLTTDFGPTDTYVAEMKAVLLTHCPDAQLFDVTHAIAPQDILAGSFALERILRVCPKQTIHIAVVDPGVGTDRPILMVAIAEQLVICPDNGLITWPWKRLPGARAYELRWRPRQLSSTFHGRDVMAVVAAKLAARSATLNEFSGARIEPILLSAAPAIGSRGQIIHIDHFGNAVTNIPADSLPQNATVRIGRTILQLSRTYADVPPGKPLALVGSSGLLEIAARNGSAARKLKLRVGTKVAITHKHTLR